MSPEDPPAKVRSLRARLAQMPLVRLAVYYALVVAGAWLLAHFLPQVWHALAGGNLEEVRSGGRHGDLSALVQGRNEPAGGLVEPDGMPQPIVAALPMIAGTLLMLPVAWVYVMTRQRKPNVDSTVQTIMLLPAVVAGVAILVRNSLPLAFSLAGIAAAINYRTRISTAAGRGLRLPCDRDGARIRAAGHSDRVRRVARLPWRFERVLAGDEPEARLEYRVRLRKKVPGPVLVAQLQGTVSGADIRAELV